MEDKQNCISLNISYFFNGFIWNILIYNVVLVSGIQRSDLTIHKHISIFFSACVFLNCDFSLKYILLCRFPGTIQILNYYQAKLNEN